MSPFAGYGATLALTFVLLAAAVKAIVEDKKRQAEDHKTNNSLTNVMKKDADGKWKEHECRWSEVKVGDVVKVFDNDLFPADLMCVHCELPERICYVKTTNLDGETNLKVKRSVAATTSRSPSCACYYGHLAAYAPLLACHHWERFLPGPTLVRDRTCGYCTVLHMFVGKSWMLRITQTALILKPF